jgi:hypothetical protein
MNFAPFAFQNSQPTSSTAELTYITNTGITTDAATYTFTNVNVTSSGLVVLAIHSEASNPNTINSVTIDGVAATIAIQKTETIPANSNALTGIAYRRITGTTATVVVSYNTNQGRCVIGVWRINNNNSDTPISTNSASATSGTGLTINLTNTSLTNVGVIGETNGTQNTTVSYTNATARYNSAIENLSQASGADYTTTTSGTRTITTTFTNSTQPITLVGAVWN